ncbi:hypothetical protein ABOM_002499 [Aspergillus bombycis]|uniref:Uncharacterized protein n=1 Tax=Aspergillus bombycis TaxID=109264 RepID=A0A1F8A9X4_9EURO|nr:hypothetical protein ABOM_002499 [Aspergillus bombycis]OGM48497.1 hypothetical protein ABOM_002499 [Aspergillus bombycis]
MESQAVSSTKLVAVLPPPNFGRKRDVEEALNQLESNSNHSNILCDGLHMLLEQLRSYIAGGGDLSLSLQIALYLSSATTVLVVRQQIQVILLYGAFATYCYFQSKQDNSLLMKDIPEQPYGF